ncbi:RDD family protein [Bacteroidota bacterium]
MENENFSYAGFWKRFLAYIIDQIILSIVNTVLFVPLFLLLIGAGIFTFEGLEEFDGIYTTSFVLQEYSDEFYFAFLSVFIVAIIFFSILSMIIQWLYFALMESSARKATLGKMALGIIVVDYSGNRITFGQATGRYFGKIISGLIFYIGFIMAGFTEKKQALHDMLASCLVINSSHNLN